MLRSMMAAACAALIAVGGCSPKDDLSLVIATVGDRVITVGDFEAAAGIMDNQYLPASDDLDGKKELLGHMINKEVVTLKARAMGYDKDPEFVQYWDEIRGAMLIAGLELQATRANEVTDEERDRYFERMHYEYTISQIVVPEESDAIALRERSLAGEDFADLARTYSLGPGADKGGFIGSNTIGRIHWWVEEALFDMEPGDISMPLRSTAGYVLIKAHNKRRVLPEQDEEWARRRLKAIKDKKTIETLKESIEKEIGLQFFPEAVNIAFDALPEQDVPYEDIMSYKVTRENAPKLRIPPRHRDMIICQYSDGKYTLADFERIYEATGLPARPRRQYGKQHIIQTMHQQVFDKVLPVYAEVKAKVLEDPEIGEKYENRRDRLLVQRLYKEQVRDEVTVTEKEIGEYYTQHHEELTSPDQRDYTLLVVADEKLARGIRKQAETSDFTLLVRTHSQADGAKDNLGRTGMHPRGAMPEFDAVAFELPDVGAISEPFETSRGWAIVKIEDIKEGSRLTFDQARDGIKRLLNDLKAEEKFNEKVEKWRAEFPIEINEKNLKSARLTRTRV